ncbi:MAG: alpha-2-macroglobulin [Flavobacteriales bacterium]|nr:alpha-2-macroglobulin [Flavobacteriales bacterium]
MTRNHFFIIALFCITAVLGLSFSPKSKNEYRLKAITLAQGDDYAKQWAVVDSLDKKGLPKSALEEVKKIMGLAIRDNNGPQIIKATIYSMKYNTYLEEDDYVLALNELNKLAENSTSPQKEMVHSITAEVYWGYYLSNRYKFLNRTNTVEFKNEDIRTWDLKTLSQRITYHYLLSLANSEVTKKITTESYAPVINAGDRSEKLRPTLYDFIAHRAIDFFRSTEFDVTRPAITFVLDKPEYFNEASRFATEKLSTSDSLSTKFYALYLFKELTAFHQGDADPAAAIVLDLERLQFVKSQSTLPNKDTLYYAALKNLENKYKTNPYVSEVQYAIASAHVAMAVAYNPLLPENAASKNQYNIALEILDAAIQQNGKTYGAELCQELKAQILLKECNIQTEDVVAPNQPSKLRIQYRNLKTVTVRIVDMGWDFINRQDYSQTDEYVEKLLSLKMVRQWEINLQDDGDHHRHAIEAEIPALPKGNYMVLVSTDPNFKFQNNNISFVPLGVSNIAYTERRNYEDESYDIAVYDRNSGAPLKNVKAQIYYKEYNYRTRRYEIHRAESYVTNIDGQFHIPATNKNYRYMYIDFTMGDDRLNSDRSYYQYKPYRYNENKVVTHFFTDRGIYRPGQTVYFKGIRISSDENGENPKIRPDEAVTVTLYDFNYQKIADLQLRTNEYGTFSGTFTAPMGVMNGQMHITDGYGSKYFSVEEYKRPKFEVNINPVQGSYKLYQNVKVTGKATAYSGANIDGAKVKYRITRSVYYPYHWYYSWYGRYPESQQTEILNGESLTDESGNFSILFPALPDEKIGKEGLPAFMYSVSADITDINGETRSANSVVYVGYSTLVLSHELPSEISIHEKKKYAIHSTNLNGSNVVANGKISVFKLKQPAQIILERRLEKSDRHQLSKSEYGKSFPLDEYENEKDQSKWEKEKEVWNYNFNTSKPDSIEFKNRNSWTPGYYLIESVAKDTFGVEVKDVRYFTVKDEKSSKMYFPEALLVDGPQGELQPGDIAKFSISSQYKNASVLMEIEEKNKIVSKKWIVLNEEQKTIEIPIEEKHRGNFGVHFTLVKNSHFYNSTHIISVPFRNKEIDIEFETFRNKILPGSQEEWRLILKGKKGEKLAAEMLMTMYDASLDAFAGNYFYLNPYPYYYAQKQWNTGFGFGNKTGSNYNENWNNYYYFSHRRFDQLNWFGYQMYYYGRYNYRNPGYYLSDDEIVSNAEVDLKATEAMAPVREEATRSKDKREDANMQSVTTATGAVADNFAMEKTIDNLDGDLSGGLNGKKNMGGEELSGVKARSNLSETAFFYPELETDENGRIIVKFTAPEALTKWKVLGLAHTKDLMTGTITKELVTQKELMVVPNAPRFFRENDRIIFTAKVSNVSDKDLKGKAQLFLFDAVTMKPVDGSFGNHKGAQDFETKKGQSASVSWELSIPENVGAVTYRVVAKAGEHSDGEEMAVPVLSNRMLVTESMPLPVRKAGTKSFRFEKLINSGNSKTLRHHNLTLEFTSNPAWYAIQAMPYMMEYPYECAEQTFTRFYSNSIATHIMNSSPKIKAVVESWKNSSPEAFLSNLEKNQELKSLMLEETPWVLEAKDESERKKRIALLFDLNRMNNELGRALKKLNKMQSSNGGWPWFEGMPESRYITQHIVTGFGHLDKLGVKNVRQDNTTWNMVRDAVRYLDARVAEDYLFIKKHHPDYREKQFINYDIIQFLYARSYFKDIEMNSTLKEALVYYKEQANKYWLNFNLYAQGMLALASNRFDQKPLAGDIVKSIREKSIHHDELGMYWKDNVVGYSWYQAPIETHALMIEMFDEVANDQESVEELKVWLLKNKQTSDWKTTKATAEACYALLLRGTAILENDEIPEIKIGNDIFDPAKQEVKVQAGTGYFKTSWSNDQIKPEMGQVTITKKKDGVAWGALYWQYFEQLDKITPHETPLKLNKKLFLVNNTPEGPSMSPVTEKTKLETGSRVRVRIELRVDRAMEYVHMKDMRASCFEPVNVFSRYKWQDGLGYFESTRDAATNFFFEYLPKGTHVFEYDLLVAHLGDFSNGITTIQCMYAPEFTSHSEGIRVNVSGK